MDYKKLYDTIINKAKSLNRKKSDDVYYEAHHIIPKCLGGSDEDENLVLLTAREHYLCHKILFRLYPNNTKLAFAYQCMIYLKKDDRKIKLSSRDYEELRNYVCNNLKGENHPMFGRKHTEESKLKNSKSKTGQKHKEESKKKISLKNKGENHPMFGREHTDESKLKNRNSHIGKRHSVERILKISESHKGEKNHFFGKKHTEESKRKMVEYRLGKKQSPETITKRVEKNRIILQERRMMIF